MSSQPHGPLRRLSMLIVAMIWIPAGAGLAYGTWPDDGDYFETERRHTTRYTRRVERRRLLFWPGVGAVIATIGVGLAITAVSPHRPSPDDEWRP